jgi:hypothetical protein
MTQPNAPTKIAMTKREFDRLTKHNSHGKMERWFLADYRTKRCLPHAGANCERHPNLAGWTFDAIEWRALERVRSPKESYARASVFHRGSKWRNVARYAANVGIPMLHRPAPTYHAYGYCDDRARYSTPGFRELAP